MNNAELVSALRSFDVCESCLCEHPEMCEDADCIVIQAADLIEAQQTALDECAKQLAEMAAQLPGVSEWKNQYGDGNWHCSKCGAIVEKDEQERHYWQWCYHCGSKMRKG